jgi:hypothetical protein
VGNNKVSESKNGQALPDRFFIKHQHRQDNEHMHEVVKQNPESKRQSRLGSLSERRKTDPIAGLDCQIQAKTKRKTTGNCQLWQSGKAKGRFFRVLRQPARQKIFVNMLP